MVKIRLRRVGAKKQPHYRVVVADSRSPRDGKFIETIGHYNPRTEPPTVEVDADRALYWLGVGAQPTEAVQRMLDKLGIISRAAAIQRGELPFDLQPEVQARMDEDQPESDLLAGATEDAVITAAEAGLAGLLAEEDAAAELEDQLSTGEEEDELEEYFDEDEDLDVEDEDEDEDWESEDLKDEEDEDLEDDWELDVDEDDDIDEDDIDEDDE